MATSCAVPVSTFAVTSHLVFVLLFSMVVNTLIMVTHQAAGPPPSAASSADYIIPSILFFFFCLPRGGTCVRDIDWVPSCHHLLFAAALFLPVLARAADCLHCCPTEASFFLLNTVQTHLVAQTSNHSTVKQQNTDDHTLSLPLFSHDALFLDCSRVSESYN